MQPSSESLAMHMLVQSGHAKNILNNIWDDLSQHELSLDYIDNQLDNSHNFLINAHKAQNKLLADIENIEYSVLVCHAQDTLSNTETIQFITEKFVNLYFKKLVTKNK